MGLDGVELIMAFEEHFGIAIPDADAARLVTPGLAIDFICTQLTLTENETCQSQRAFYQLRRGLISVLGKRRGELEPNTALRDLTVNPDCSSWWPQLKDETRAREWPRLTRPYWMEQTILFLTLTVLIGIPLGAHLKNGKDGLALGIVCGVGAAIALPNALVALTRRWRTRIPRDHVVLRDLISYVATSDSIQWDRELVANVVKDIVLRQLGIAESKYSEDAHFVNDLGVE